MTMSDEPGEALRFWFPVGHESALERHRQQWLWWMRGGAHEAVRERFTGLVEEAAQGGLLDWAVNAKGRLALILVLDQFSRSVYDGSPKAYAQDDRALALVQEGLTNGHYDQLETVWEKTFYAMPLVHTEGIDAPLRADRCVALAEALIPQAPTHLVPMYEFAAEQARKHQRVLRAFGRHPHRNALLGRKSTDAEENYLRQGEFPHLTNIALAD